jgi:DNA-binding MarR family transcriptional regulator
MTRSDQIIELLHTCPQGITAKEVARKLGAEYRNINSQLSKLSAYGLIKKVRGSADHAAVYSQITD